MWTLIVRCICICLLDRRGSIEILCTWNQVLSIKTTISITLLLEPELKLLPASILSKCVLLDKMASITSLSCFCDEYRIQVSCTLVLLCFGTGSLPPDNWFSLFSSTELAVAQLSRQSCELENRFLGLVVCVPGSLKSSGTPELMVVAAEQRLGFPVFIACT